MKGHIQQRGKNSWRLRDLLGARVTFEDAARDS
jgi:hypothetical protein